jgi:hypothetical protein
MSADYAPSIQGRGHLASRRTTRKERDLQCTTNDDGQIDAHRILIASRPRTSATCRPGSTGSWARTRRSTRTRRTSRSASATRPRPKDTGVHGRLRRYVPHRRGRWRLLVRDRARGLRIAGAPRARSAAPAARANDRSVMSDGIGHHRGIRFLFAVMSEPGGHHRRHGRPASKIRNAQPVSVRDLMERDARPLPAPSGPTG